MNQLIFKYMTSKYITIAIIFITTSLFTANISYAGNKDRSGQAGASELLINPWARSSGWGGVNTSNAMGLEATFSNVAGVAFTNKTELVFAHTQWLQGSGISINAFGFSQKVGSLGVLGMTVCSIGFGEIERTTVDQPEGGIGTFSPKLMNIALFYARAFSSSIYGGVSVRVISESTAEITGTGVAIDAGIQYVTGKTDNIKFGISLKNIGPTMKFSGDGLSFRNTINGNQMTVEQRSADFELPSLLNIGASYDFRFPDHRLTLAGNFRANAFMKDEFTLGLEYAFKTYLMLRGAYTYENGIFNSADRTSAYFGPSAGITIQAPLNKKGSTFSIDYSYRFSDPYKGTHTIGARINL